MRVAIPHKLDKDEVRRRIKGSAHEIVDFLPDRADVSTSWQSDDRMTLNVGAMGQSITGDIDIQDGQVVFTVNLPPMMAFVEPMVKSAIKAKGQKLLT